MAPWCKFISIFFLFLFHNSYVIFIWRDDHSLDYYWHISFLLIDDDFLSTKTKCCWFRSGNFVVVASRGTGASEKKLSAAKYISSSSMMDTAQPSLEENDSNQMAVAILPSNSSNSISSRSSSSATSSVQAHRRSSSLVRAKSHPLLDFLSHTKVEELASSPLVEYADSTRT